VEAPPVLINAVSTQSNNGRYSNICREIDIKKKRCKQNNATFVTRSYGPGSIVQLRTTEAIPKGREILTYRRGDSNLLWSKKLKNEK